MEEQLAILTVFTTSEIKTLISEECTPLELDLFFELYISGLVTDPTTLGSFDVLCSEIGHKILAIGIIIGFDSDGVEKGRRRDRIPILFKTFPAPCR